MRCNFYKRPTLIKSATHAYKISCPCNCTSAGHVIIYQTDPDLRIESSRLICSKLNLFAARVSRSFILVMHQLLSSKSKNKNQRFFDSFLIKMISVSYSNQFNIPGQISGFLFQLAQLRLF